MSEIHQVEIREEYLQLIKQGHKMKEGRIKQGIFQRIKVDDFINFFCPLTESQALAKVVSVEEFPNFEEMLNGNELEKYLPGIKSVKDGVAIYYSFPGYKQKEKECGVLGIGISLVE